MMGGVASVLGMKASSSIFRKIKDIGSEYRVRKKLRELEQNSY
jgi:hypothetical protein